MSGRIDHHANATYTSMTGCDSGGSGERGGVVVNMCKYKEYGCAGAKKHKSNRSKHCEFSGIDHKIIGK